MSLLLKKAYEIKIRCCEWFDAAIVRVKARLQVFYRMIEALNLLLVEQSLIMVDK